MLIENYIANCTKFKQKSGRSDLGKHTWRKNIEQTGGRARKSGLVRYLSESNNQQ